MKSITKHIAQLLLLAILCISTQMLIAQDISQTIRGKILHKDNQSGLIGVTVVLLDGDKQLGTVSDLNGDFRLDDIPVGRHQLQFSYVGFKTLILSEILVESGKEELLNIELSPLSTALAVVEVKGQASSLDLSYIPLSVKTLSIEETLRFPATFYDPARLAVSFAGVVNDNDQANGISIRGQSPNHLSWQLEGVDIVNPNHLSNAGTTTDRPTTNGGGVNILSAQLLGTSNFLTGAFPANYGNALSGIMDMRLRKGNDEQHEFTGQIGLIGIDLAAEGPLAGKASYLVNYRYSTLGLLAAMGVQLGDEIIKFQDLAFNINMPLKKGTFTLFGMGGRSSNVFEAERDIMLWEFEKDNQDIRYENDMGALGATFTLPIGDKTIWRSVAAFSGLQTTRQADFLDRDLRIQERFQYDELANQIASFASNIQHRINAKNKLRIGVNVSQRAYDFITADQTSDQINEATDGILIQPYAAWQWQRNRWTVNAGLHYNYFTINNAQALEPRFSLRKNINNTQNISFAYGLHSQLPRPQLYFSNWGVNENLAFAKAHHFVLAYENQLTNALKYSAEIYYQQLFNIPTIPLNPEGAVISSLNFLDEWIATPFENEGKGRNYGLELSLQQKVKNDFYYLVNATLYRSEYLSQEWQPTRYDGNYIFNLTAGKEWKKQRENRTVILGVNGRATYLGGYNRMPIDESLSAQFGITSFDLDAGFSIQQEDYFKVDLRIYYKRNKRKYSNTLALDIQNVTNSDNVAYYYFDTAKQEIVRKKQLGLIPILTYRIEF